MPTTKPVRMFLLDRSLPYLRPRATQETQFKWGKPQTNSLHSEKVKMLADCELSDSNLRKVR